MIQFIMITRTNWLLTALLTLFLFLPSYADAQHTMQRVLTLDEAKEILAAAEARAHQDNWTVAIAIMDAGGHLIAFSRIDGTQVGSIDVAINKAKSSILYKRPTKAFEDAMNAGNNRIPSLGGVVPFEGGIPIEHDGAVIGAIGVSGVTAEQDGVIARAGLSVLR